MFGFTSRNATVVGTEQRGSDDIYYVLTTAIRKRPAIRQAKLEVHPLIPLRDIEVINTALDRDLGVRKRYIVTISHNTDDGEDDEDNGYY